MAEAKYMGAISLDELSRLIKEDFKKASMSEETIATAVESYLAKNPIDYNHIKGIPEPIRNSTLQEVLK